MSANGSHSAQVTALTAEVRALMIGSRQVTLSVYRQLDWAMFDENFEPFGRVSPPRPKVRHWEDANPGVEMVGKDLLTGSLVRSFCSTDWQYGENSQRQEHARALPLIVLAGLR